MTHDQAVAFGSLEGVGEYFAGEAVEGVIEVW